MAKVPNTSPANDRIGVDEHALRPWANARGRNTDAGHRGSDATSDAITCVFRHAAIPQGPVSQSTGAPSIGSLKLEGRLGAAALWNFVPLGSALIMASATPFCFCTTQKHITVKRAMSSRG